MRVGHQQPAQAVDRQAARAVDVELGRAPAVKILAVAVEDLDPIGQIGQIKVVVANRTRPCAACAAVPA